MLHITMSSAGWGSSQSLAVVLTTAWRLELLLGRAEGCGTRKDAFPEGLWQGLFSAELSSHCGQQDQEGNSSHGEAAP